MSDTWILYQTTNICNGKIYVGVHKVTDTPTSRGYLGSGNALKVAIEKYGRKNFERKTLAEFSCPEDAYVAESEMVDENFVKRKDTYNMKMGGMGGIGTKGIPLSLETRAKLSAAHKGKRLSDEHKAKIGAKSKGRKNNLGKVFSAETRAKMSASAKVKEISLETRAKRSKLMMGNTRNLGKVFSEEHKANMRAASPRSKPVIVNGKYYTSLNQAAKFEKIADSTVRDRIESCKPKWVEWRFATEEEIANFLREGALAEKIPSCIFEHHT
jgi:group I intron endonuclease